MFIKEEIVIKSFFVSNHVQNNYAFEYKIQKKKNNKPIIKKMKISLSLCAFADTKASMANRKFSSLDSFQL